MNGVYPVATEITIGIITGLVMNALWYYYWAFMDSNPSSRAKIRGKYAWRRIFHWLEHFHWATILLILGCRLGVPLFVGVSISLFADEGLSQQHKFSLGSGHEKESFLIEILIIALWIVIELIYRLFAPI